MTKISTITPNYLTATQDKVSNITPNYLTAKKDKTNTVNLFDTKKTNTTTSWPKILFSDEQSAYDKMINDGITDTKARDIIKSRRKQMLWGINQTEWLALMKMQKQWIDSKTAVDVINTQRKKEQKVFKWVRTRSYVFFSKFFRSYSFCNASLPKDVKQFGNDISISDRLSNSRHCFRGDFHWLYQFLPCLCRGIQYVV